MLARLVLCLIVVLGISPQAYAQRDKAPKIIDDPATVARLKVVARFVRESDGHVISLMLQGSAATAENLKLLQGLGGLESLSVQQNDDETKPITDDDLKLLAGQVSLKSLQLERCLITGTGFSHLQRLKKLERISLYHCPIDNDGLKVICGLTSLTGIGCSDTKITNDGLKHLSVLPKLASLGMSNCGIDDGALEHLKANRALQTIAVGSTKVTGSGFRFLSTELLIMNLSDCPISAEGFKALARFRKLKNLYMRGVKADVDTWAKLLEALPACQIDFNKPR
ncbi:MAG: hypothetical protein WD768_21290 [Phycisphaeraceae bacterium]